MMKENPVQKIEGRGKDSPSPPSYLIEDLVEREARPRGDGYDGVVYVPVAIHKEKLPAFFRQTADNPYIQMKFHAATDFSYGTIMDYAIQAHDTFAIAIILDYWNNFEAEKELQFQRRPNDLHIFPELHKNPLLTLFVEEKGFSEADFKVIFDSLYAFSDKGIWGVPQLMLSMSLATSVTEFMLRSPNDEYRKILYHNLKTNYSEEEQNHSFQELLMNAALRNDQEGFESVLSHYREGQLEMPPLKKADRNLAFDLCMSLVINPGEANYEKGLKFFGFLRQCKVVDYNPEDSSLKKYPSTVKEVVERMTLHWDLQEKLAKNVSHIPVLGPLTRF